MLRAFRVCWLCSSGDRKTWLGGLNGTKQKNAMFEVDVFLVVSDSLENDTYRLTMKFCFASIAALVPER